MWVIKGSSMKIISAVCSGRDRCASGHSGWVDTHTHGPEWSAWAVMVAWLQTHTDRWGRSHCARDWSSVTVRRTEINTVDDDTVNEPCVCVWLSVRAGCFRGDSSSCIFPLGDSGDWPRPGAQLDTGRCFTHSWNAPLIWERSCCRSSFPLTTHTWQRSGWYKIICPCFHCLPVFVVPRSKYLR